MRRPAEHPVQKDAFSQNPQIGNNRSADRNNRQHQEHPLLDTVQNQPKYLLDPYLDWVRAEGIPVIEDFGLDLLAVETKPWARFGAAGAAVHLKGRGDFMALFVLDIAPGGSTTPQRHLYEEVVYVLEGHGSTTVEADDGRKHTFEWGPRSLFALPLNSRYQHFNSSGRERARLCSATDLPMMLNIFHNDEFIFDNQFRFRDRAGKPNFFSGEGDFLPMRPGRHMWETNFIPDLGAFELKSWAERGAGGTNMIFILADGIMHAHSSEMPVGTYKKGHRHGADFHVFCVRGTGYSLLWYPGDKDFVRVDWRHGVVFAPPDGMFHQHFNTNPTPARYLAIAVGSMRYPLVAAKRALFDTGVDTSVKDGGNQIEYQDQDPRIHQVYLQELAKTGVVSGMGKFIDENR
jgi:cupin superfamily acireductone dioxygenase involved in methionine salvage